MFSSHLQPSIIDYLQPSIIIFYFLQRFNEAAERVKTLTKRPTDKELLELYAFFKQGTFGDNKTSKLLRNSEEETMI